MRLKSTEVKPFGQIDVAKNEDYWAVEKNLFIFSLYVRILNCILHRFHVVRTHFLTSFILNA